jgi:hypothetical protein
MVRPSECLQEDRETTDALPEKPVPVPRCPSQIPRGMALDRTRVTAMGSRRQTA